MYVRILFLLGAVIFGSSCASFTAVAGTRIQNVDSILSHERNVHEKVRRYFRPDIARELIKDVTLVFKQANAPLPTGSLAGQYNPFSDSIAIVVSYLNATVVVHEFLHRVWCYNMTGEEREAFVNDLSVVYHSKEYYWFKVWLDSILGDTWILRDTESYSYIGGYFVTFGYHDMPLELRRHYNCMFGKWTGVYRTDEIRESATVRHLGLIATSQHAADGSASKVILPWTVVIATDIPILNVEIQVTVTQADGLESVSCFVYRPNKDCRPYQVRDEELLYFATVPEGFLQLDEYGGLCGPSVVFSVVFYPGMENEMRYELVYDGESRRIQKWTRAEPSD